ncbi:hypothetical protein M7I_3562 [Glarea lozoyensis 74030]|uniref:PH domain-containing protein n=1 Tax=Glarea lozoyensis (strain ATCC 74030 / MF5533) TaxID=1104152 RepID=H0ELU1_GLAL7|nr:hypothetical protein M7I_3562 [Glarea lozoyensis 74030]
MMADVQPVSMSPTVAKLKDPKHKRVNVFGLFSPSRNYHLEAASKKDTEEWVGLIRREARIEEEEEEMMLASPTGVISGSYAGFERAFHKHTEQRRLHEERVGSSSPEPMDPPIRLSKKNGPVFAPGRRMSHTIDYSGTDIASHSDLSDTEVSRPFQPTEPLAVKPPPRPDFAVRNSSQISGFNPDLDPERVIWQGHLLYLKSKGGVITEEKSFKFCARGEDQLDKSLGALKSLLARRKEEAVGGRVM